ncbi:hypothetical protein G6549_04690 [Bacillus sp. MM2020_1]|nr:hypothetical protein [Bacillus sp. MM2020_1]
MKNKQLINREVIFRSFAGFFIVSSFRAIFEELCAILENYVPVSEGFVLLTIYRKTKSFSQLKNPVLKKQGFFMMRSARIELTF